MRYIAKEYTYFDPGTEVILLDPHKYHKLSYGFFQGYRYGVKCKAMCRFDEFEIVEFEDYYDTVRD